MAHVVGRVLGALLKDLDGVQVLEQRGGVDDERDRLWFHTARADGETAGQAFVW